MSALRLFSLCEGSFCFWGRLQSRKLSFGTLDNPYKLNLSNKVKTQIDYLPGDFYNDSKSIKGQPVMKVLIISASPRKGGNSDVLCDQFAKGAVAAGHEVEKVNLREKKLSPCRACYGCMANHICTINDDMKEIFPKLVAADVIVLSSPVYFYSLSSQMKMLIDRCLVDHKSISGKQFYFIITAADPQHEAGKETLAAFRGFLRCLPDAKESGVIYGTGTWDKGDVFQHPSYDEAYGMGRQV